ncbi:MAG: hypothetical protein CMJ19_10585 [Phycisphaeraceae bacterium]|nr:hypothetical protein [Phycisphaeraceae bacterium]
MDNRMINCEHCDTRLVYLKLQNNQMSGWQWLLHSLVLLLGMGLAVYLIGMLDEDYLLSVSLSIGQKIRIYLALVAVLIVTALCVHLLAHRYVVRKPKCRRCDYSLAEIASDACPECGWEFDREGQWYLGTGKYDQYPGLEISEKWILFFATSLLVLSTLGSLAYSQLTRGRLDEIGLPFTFYGSFSRNTFNRAWSWELLLADIAACLFLGIGLEYLRQWIKQRIKQCASSGNQ